MSFYLFSGMDFVDALRYRQTRTKKSPVNIEDVYDGNLYKEHFDPDGFFHGTTQEEKQHQLHISLQINTDGVSIFKSSKFGIWPIYAVINELSPSSR
jgi:hypothetical protein